MAVNHASLTGASLHEPKGAETAQLGQVYIADGNGSGSWTSIAETSFTGQIADFCTPVAPTGWLECDGSDVNTTTYAALYASMTIQQTGTRTNSSAIITGLSSTTHMRAGYYVFGTGIASGTTIVSVDSATQITLSAAVGSSGTSTVVVSPWLLNTGTIRLPNLTGGAYYRRSRTSGTRIGLTQTDQNKSHVHSYSGSTSVESQFHTHGFSNSGTTAIGTASAGTHTHNVTAPTSRGISVNQGTSGNLVTGLWQGVTTEATDSAGAFSSDHIHGYTLSGTTATENQTHGHTYSGSTASGSADGSEARPITMIFITCVKT